MPPKAPPTATSAAALETVARPSTARPAGGAVGQSGSPDALRQLTAAMAELKAVAAQPLLQRAVAALQAEDHVAGFKWAQMALERDKDNGFGWYLMAIARERGGDFGGSVTAYEKALDLIPDHAEVANDLGRLAYRLDMKPQAEKLFRHFLARHPDHPEGVNNLACAIRDQGRFEEAIEDLRPAILKSPEKSMLWNTMGTILAEQGDYPNAFIFFQEALRLEPDFPKARYNLGNAHLALGDADSALEACERALEGLGSDDERAMMRLSRSTILMNLGRLGEGWDEYEARFEDSFADVVYFLIDRPQWSPGCDLSGKSLMIFAEQGLGDEVLFGNILPDVLEQLGPQGRLTLAVEPRLVTLFARSFPTATVLAHATHSIHGRTVRHAPALKDAQSIDLWAPIGSLMREFRRTLDAFPSRVGFLTPDPDRVAHWKRVLETEAPAGLKVGLLWKSAIGKDARHRFFSPFAHWASVLKVEGASFINLQYGDCSQELAMAERDFGVRIWTPPNVDLKQDLEDVTALGVAVDLVLGFSNATLNLAAACGAPTWLISTPGAWPRLGTMRYPWYPQVRTFTTPAFGAWAPIMDSVGDALAAHMAER
jgi:tetratricopeptide (TPR) repeat protein